MHGTQDLANVLLRSGVPFEYVTSHLQRPGGGWTSWATSSPRRRPCTACAGARLGLLGYPFPGMGDFALDTTHLAATLGCEWTVLPMEEYIRRAADATPKAAADLVAEYRGDLRRGRRT